MIGTPAYHLDEVRKENSPSFRLRIDRLEVCKGEVFVLLGPTGAGKSTLLRLLAGLEIPTTGSVRFENQSIAKLAVRRRIVMVHQRPLLLTGSVRFNIEYGLRVRGAKGRLRSVDAMIEQLRLGELASRSANALSGGQIQLVALARSLVIEPDVLLLDEPTANLDPAHVALVEETVLRKRENRKLTVVWATHQLFQARRLADRVALLLEGQLAEVAETDAFFEHPADQRTADFVQGRMVY